MKIGTFEGYTITEDGTIYGKHNKILTLRWHKDRYEVRLNGKIYILARIIYKAFNPDFAITDRDLCITFKDGNKKNIHIDNLECKHRKDIIQGENHKIRAKLTNEQAEEIRQLWEGKAGNNQFDKKTFSLQEIADAYGITKGNVQMIINGKSRNVNNYKLK